MNAISSQHLNVRVIDKGYSKKIDGSQIRRVGTDFTDVDHLQSMKHG